MKSQEIHSISYRSAAKDNPKICHFVKNPDILGWNLELAAFSHDRFALFALFARTQYNLTRTCFELSIDRAYIGYRYQSLIQISMDMFTSHLALKKYHMHCTISIDTLCSLSR